MFSLGLEGNLEEMNESGLTKGGGLGKSARDTEIPWGETDGYPGCGFG